MWKTYLLFWQTYLLFWQRLCYNENHSKPTTRNLTFSGNKTCSPWFWNSRHIWYFLLSIQASKNYREQRMVQIEQAWNTNQIIGSKKCMRIRNMLPILFIIFLLQLTLICGALHCLLLLYLSKHHSTYYKYFLVAIISC